MSDELRANVLRSVQSATSAFEHLERSLEAGGFGASLGTYQRMAQTLIGQRMWARTRGPDPDLDRAFAALARSAAEVQAILEAYAHLAGRLRVVGDMVPGTDALVPAPATAAPTGMAAGEAGSVPAPDDAKGAKPAVRIQQALSSGEALSMSRLRTVTGLGRKELEEALQGLEKLGKVSVENRASRATVRQVLGGRSAPAPPQP